MCIEVVVVIEAVVVETCCCCCDARRFIAERASFGEGKERLYALELPDTPGGFYQMYKAVQPRLVTEFVYRHSPQEVAHVFMSLEKADDDLSPEEVIASNYVVISS